MRTFKVIVRKDLVKTGDTLKIYKRDILEKLAEPKVNTLTDGMPPKDLMYWNLWKSLPRGRQKCNLCLYLKQVDR